VYPQWFDVGDFQLGRLGENIQPLGRQFLLVPWMFRHQVHIPVALHPALAIRIYVIDTTGRHGLDIFEHHLSVKDVGERK